MTTIIICVHNALECVKKCLSSILENTSVSYKIILINDYSDEITKAFLLNFSTNKNVTLINNSKNIGYTKSANLGMKMVETPFFVLLNSDTIVTKNWLSKLKRHFREDNTIGIVGPLSNAAGFQSIPKVYNNQGGYCINKIPKEYSIQEFADICEFQSLKMAPSVQFVNGFCMMIKKEVFQKIGYFDEHLFPLGYGEEIDFCLRAKRQGFTIVVADNVFIYHEKSKSFGPNKRDSLAKEAREKNRTKYGNAELEKVYLSIRENRYLKLIRENIRLIIHTK